VKLRHAGGRYSSFRRSGGRVGGQSGFFWGRKPQRGKKELLEKGDGEEARFRLLKKKRKRKVCVDPLRWELPQELSRLLTGQPTDLDA